MTTTRSRDGTLPTRTMEAVLGGLAMRNVHGRTLKQNRGRPRKSSQNLEKSVFVSARPGLTYLKTNSSWALSSNQLICRLKTPNYRDELANIVGCDERPYFGLFGADHEGSQSTKTRPTAEDRALFHHSNTPHHHSQDLRPFSHDASLLEMQKPPKDQENPGITIHYGCSFTMDAWYRSAYPAEYTRRDYLSVCSYCLDYSKSDLTIERHRIKCCRRVPPGREIYRDGNLSMWEVDGLTASLYCQNLCLLTKSFLQSKSLYKDVQPFFFYVLTKFTGSGSEFVGYFSKQKMYSLFKPEQPIQSVSCIMALPFTQLQGFGQFLIEFSYLLTKLQQGTGSPETPLSRLGEIAFRNFWKKSISISVKHHLDSQIRFSISDISKDTGIHINHVVLTLEDLGWLNPTKTGEALNIDKARLDGNVQEWEARAKLRVRPELLMWAPLYE